MLKLNNETMQKNGFTFHDVDDLCLYIYPIIEWLESHNKNLTKEQYYKILAVKEALECVNIE